MYTVHSVQCTVYIVHYVIIHTYQFTNILPSGDNSYKTVYKYNTILIGNYNVNFYNYSNTEICYGVKR